VKAKPFEYTWPVRYFMAKKVFVVSAIGSFNDKELAY